jgi:uncharacterized protein (TIGR04222 family)
MNEFDLLGPQFLSYYLPATFGTIFGAIAIRGLLKNPKGEYADLDMTAYEAAYLSGGDRRVMEAAVAKLMVSEVLTTTAYPPFFKAAKDLTGNIDPVERAIHSAAKNHAISHVRDMYKYVAPVSNNIRPKLIAAGLILSDGQTAAIRTICTLMTLIPVLFWGMPKILLGMSRHKPVAFLVALCGLGLFAALFFLGQTWIRTTRGDAALDNLKAENRALEYSIQHGTPGSDNEFAMATGLFGTAILLTSPLFLPMRNFFGSAWSGSTGGSSGFGCGSSCGGGGCGGGGCGGCGG